MHKIKSKSKSSNEKNVLFQPLVNKANECKNPLLEIDQKMLSESNFTFTFKQSNELNDEEMEWILDLTERNMKEMYEQSEWGWSRSSKESEFKHKQAKFVFVADSNKGGKHIAFTHCRFAFDEDGYFPIVYCYELQVEQEYHRIGIGKQLMNILYAFGEYFKMKKVILTTFKRNQMAMDFYTKGLGYKIDRWSPSKFGSIVDYEILSLPIKRKAQ